MGDQLPNINGASDDKALLEPSQVQFGSSATTTEANSEMTIADDNTKIMSADAEAPELIHREHWDNPMEFLMSCIAMSVGLGNIWRFPFTAYKNGGGAFLIPYIIVLIFVARPIYFMELCLGQFSSCSQVDVWSCVPLFRGIGFTTGVATAALLTYYCSINALTVYYFFASCQEHLPWTVCNEKWTGKGGCSNITKANSSFSELYFIKEVLNEKEDISDGIGWPEWKLTLCLLFAWLAILLTLIRGIKSSGKVAYFFAIYPYVVLLVLLGIGCSLKGASNGVIYFINPQWEKLLDPKVWFAAITQCFYSLNTGFGSIIMYSSYNRFNHKIYRDSLIISVMDTFTSLLAGFTIFAVLGHLADLTGYPIEYVVKNGGTSLAFISYPETISKLKYVPQLLAVLFFLMLFSLGVGSSVSDAGALIAVFADKFPKFAKWKITSIICVVCFLIGLVYVTPGGQAVLELVDFYGASFVIFITTTLEVIAIAWVYGLGNFARDIEFMLSIKIGWYWKLSWAYIIPLALPVILIYSLKQQSTPEYGHVPFPPLAIACGWLLALGSLSLLPIFAFLVLWKMPGNLLERLLASVRPTERWGPEDSTVKKEWIAYKADHPIQEPTKFSKLLNYFIIFVYLKFIIFISSCN